MNAEKLLGIVKSRGLSLQRREQTLYLRGPKEMKTSALLEQIQSHKNELLELLGRRRVLTCQWVVTDYDGKVRAIPKKDLDEASDLLYWQQQFWFTQPYRTVTVKEDEIPKEWEVKQW